MIIWNNSKVEKILKASMDLIQSHSPSVKIQIMGGKVCSRCKGKTLLGQQVFQNNKFVDITQQCFALLLQVNFPANNLNFHWRWRWWDRIQAVFINLFYLKWFTFNWWLNLMPSFRRRWRKLPLPLLFLITLDHRNTIQVFNTLRKSSKNKRNLDPKYSIYIRTVIS